MSRDVTQSGDDDLVDLIPNRPGGAPPHPSAELTRTLSPLFFPYVRITDPIINPD
jgi:hypothetical protein